MKLAITVSNPLTYQGWRAYRVLELLPNSSSWRELPTAESLTVNIVESLSTLGAVAGAFMLLVAGEAGSRAGECFSALRGDDLAGVGGEPRSVMRGVLEVVSVFWVVTSEDFKIRKCIWVI
jgi:hypothetical protein